MTDRSSGRDEWAVAGLGPGSVLAGYRIEARIGAGGMATVLRARDEALGRTVALKILPPASADNAQFRERFIRESRAVAAVDHPHIIPVYAAGEASGVLYLAMRYVTGGDLRSVVRREGPLPGERAVTLLSPIASALDAAHRAGLVHRDVKPANILVEAGPGRPEHPYLSDFGLAKGAASSTGLTGTGQYLGTPDYSAPEQISGQGTSPRTDQYALACVAYTVLTGTPPFARDESMAVLWAQMYDQPPAVTGRRPDLPAAADQVIARALGKAQGERYATCTEFISALGAALAGPTRARREEGFTAARPPAADAATWPQRPDRSTQTAAPARGQTGMPLPPSPSGPALTDIGQRHPFEASSVPPVTAPADPGAAPGRPQHRAGRRPRRPVIMVSLGVAVLLAGGGGYALWRANSGQDRYSVGVSVGGYVSVLRGSGVLSSSTLEASMLTDTDQVALQRTIPANSLSDAEQRIDRLQAEANACRQTYQRLAAWQTQDLAYQRYLTAKALATKNKTKPPAVVISPGAMPAQVPNADECAPSTAFGIPVSVLPASGESAPPAAG